MKGDWGWAGTGSRGNWDGGLDLRDGEAARENRVSSSADCRVQLVGRATIRAARLPGLQGVSPGRRCSNDDGSTDPSRPSSPMAQEAQEEQFEQQGAGTPAPVLRAQDKPLPASQSPSQHNPQRPSCCAWTDWGGRSVETDISDEIGSTASPRLSSLERLGGTSLQEVDAMDVPKGGLEVPSRH